MSDKKPNLFIIGAMKSATTSLHHCLGQHPEIFMCGRKEPTYFVDPRQLREIWPNLERAGLWKSEASYLSLFDGVDGERIIGESSTGYTKMNAVSGVAERIAKFNPDARFIYLMRDPIERAISHYWHAVFNDGESHGMLHAIKHNPHYLEVSNYAMQLEPYLECFGRPAIRTYTMEEFLADQNKVLGELYDWLGVDREFSPAGEEVKENAIPVEHTGFVQSGVLYRIKQSRWWDGVGNYVPKPLRAMANRMATRKVSKTNEERDEVIEYARPIVAPMISELSTLLDRSFGEWDTSVPCSRRAGSQEGFEAVN